MGRTVTAELNAETVSKALPQESRRVVQTAETVRTVAVPGGDQRRGDGIAIHRATQYLPLMNDYGLILSPDEAPAVAGQRLSFGSATARVTGRRCS